jgi:hypothetical protein
MAYWSLLAEPVAVLVVALVAVPIAAPAASSQVEAHERWLADQEAAVEPDCLLLSYWPNSFYDPAPHLVP